MSKLTNLPTAGGAAAGLQALDSGTNKWLPEFPPARARPLRSRLEQTAENRSPEASGTGAANKNSLSGAGQAAIRSKLRSTAAITYRDAANLLDAAAFAVSIGIPLNRFLTVHTEAGGVTDALKARARLAKLMHDWVKSKGGRFAHVTVRESGEGKGEHFHMLLHVSADLRDGFNRRQTRWLRTAGLKRAKGVAYTRPVGRFYYYSRSNSVCGEHYAANLSEALDYMLKGVEPKARKLLAIRRRAFGGEMQGKRCFHSENIGRAARSRASEHFKARNESRLMIAENLAGRGTEKLHCCLAGHRDRTAPRTNRNMGER